MAHSISSIMASLGVSDGTAAGEPTRGAPAPSAPPPVAPGPTTPTFATEEAPTSAPDLGMGAWDDLIAADPPVAISQPAPVTEPPPAPAAEEVEEDTTAEAPKGKRGRPAGARNKPRELHPANRPEVPVVDPRDEDDGEVPPPAADYRKSGGWLPQQNPTPVVVNVQLDGALTDRLEALEVAVQGIGEGLAALARSLCDGMAASRAEAVASLEAAHAVAQGLHVHLDKVVDTDAIASAVVAKVAAARRVGG